MNEAGEKDFEESSVEQRFVLYSNNRGLSQGWGVMGEGGIGFGPVPQERKDVTLKVGKADSIREWWKIREEEN